jgi:hypothetical protein
MAVDIHPQERFEKQFFPAHGKKIYFIGLLLI